MGYHLLVPLMPIEEESAGAWQRLQPHVVEAATVCYGSCNRMSWRLQPYVMEAAAVCYRGCNRLRLRLSPYTAQARG